MTTDEARGILYMPFGAPSSTYYGGDRHGANLFGNSLVAIHAQTGKYKWHFQTVHHDIWDYDLPPAPGLVDIVKDGRKIPALAQEGKTGLMFILDRVTGKPVFGVEERPVPKSDVPEEETWPIHTRSFALSAAGLQILHGLPNARKPGAPLEKVREQHRISFGRDFIGHTDHFGVHPKGFVDEQNARNSVRQLRPEHVGGHLKSVGAAEFFLRLNRCGHGSRYLAKQGLGFQPAASGCFLKSVVVTKGLPKYVGSVTTVVTVNQSLSPGSVKRS